jgi:hypothetical protein
MSTSVVAVVLPAVVLVLLVLLLPPLSLPPPQQLSHSASRLTANVRIKAENRDAKVMLMLQ